MRSDDRSDMPKVEDRAMAASPTARAEDTTTRSMERVAAEGRNQSIDPPMTVAEQRREENKKFFAEERKKSSELTKEMESVHKDMDGAKASNMKLWIVEPLNPNEGPFMYSNTANRMIIAAPTERTARHMAFVAEGDEWRDENRVKVSELKIESPTVITRDFRG